MASIWELDFYSRPILDEQNKKIWEVLVCESPVDGQRPAESLFRYAQFCPSSQVNSVWLRTALSEAIAQAPEPPNKIRFFRRQMTNMITRACQELDIKALPSRRTFALHQWLQERSQTVYPELDGFQAGGGNLASSAVTLEMPPSQPLPDALRPEQWAFVTLEAGAFAEMAEWSIDFGEAFPLEMLKLDPKTPIPGLVLFSQRALPLAGWMSGLEVAFVQVESTTPARLVLNTGASDRWTLVNLNTAQLQTEAQSFAKTKQNAQQVHFLAVQSDPNAETFAGFWLLQELNLG